MKLNRCANIDDNRLSEKGVESPRRITDLAHERASESRERERARDVDQPSTLLWHRDGSIRAAIVATAGYAMISFIFSQCVQ